MTQFGNTDCFFTLNLSFCEGLAPLEQSSSALALLTFWAGLCEEGCQRDANLHILGYLLHLWLDTNNTAPPVWQSKFFSQYCQMSQERILQVENHSIQKKNPWATQLVTWKDRPSGPLSQKPCENWAHFPTSAWATTHPGGLW